MDPERFNKNAWLFPIVGNILAIVVAGVLFAVVGHNKPVYIAAAIVAAVVISFFLQWLLFRRHD